MAGRHPTLVGTRETADLLGISRARINQLASEGHMPTPVGILRFGQKPLRVWRKRDIVRWAQESGRLDKRSVVS